MITYYDVLNITEDATQKEIKEAYRSLSKQHHPDKGGDSKKFDSINKAYQVLINPEERATYDRYGVDNGEMQKRIDSAVQCFEEAVRRNDNDILASIVKLEDEAIKMLNQQKKEFNENIDKKNKILSRIIECLVNDFLGNHLKKEIKNMGLQIEMINHAVSEITESGKLFKDYEFSVEVKNKNETALSWSYQQ